MYDGGVETYLEPLNDEVLNSRLAEGTSSSHGVNASTAAVDSGVCI
jgi:hypothetical protein